MLSSSSSSSSTSVKQYLCDPTKYSKFHFFWGTKGGYYSQWVKAPMKINGKTFVTCEQYMMHQKALLFNDQEMAEKILKTSDPKQCKEFGRKVKNFDTSLWESNRDRIVYEGNYAKFSQHEEMRKDLLSRPNVEYVEASPYDKIWGIGLEEKDQRAHDKSQWKGLNLLGRIITQVRDDLMNEK